MRLEEKRKAEEITKLEKQNAQPVITEKSMGVYYRDKDGSQIDIAELQRFAESQTTEQREVQEPPKKVLAPIIIGAAVVGIVVAGVIIVVAVL